MTNAKTRTAKAAPRRNASAPRAMWLRDAPGGALSARPSYLIESRDEIRRVWDRAAALAIDFIQNSGELKGAVDQVIADTVGVELKLAPKPDLAGLGYTAAEAKAWADIVKLRWRQWAWNPRECDLRGKFNVPTMIDIALRHQIAYGEATALLDFMGVDQRRRYGVVSGVKVCLMDPPRLVRDTNEAEGLYSGVVHDSLSRPVAYRFRERVAGIETKRDYPAFDADGRPVVAHVFDPWSATDVRGVSVIAAALRSHANASRLGDATVATAILQTIFAATLTSPNPSKDAFEAIEALEDDGLKKDFIDYFGGSLERASESSIVLNGSPQVSSLAPGEKLDLLTARTPGPDFLPFANSFKREMARCIGVTYTSYSLDHKGSTYSSVRMENSSIWPVVLRRRERIAAPLCQAIYEVWLDAEIGEGRIPFRGGYRAFRANRDRATWAEWQGPAAPTADDYKSARAATERLLNGTSSLDIECALLGVDKADLMASRGEDIAECARLGLPNPYQRMQGGGGQDMPPDSSSEDPADDSAA